MEHFKRHPNITSEKRNTLEVLDYGFDFTDTNSALRSTRKVLTQMVEALIFIHKNDCYHVGLQSFNSFVFMGDILQIDLGGIKTKDDLSLGTRTPESDVADLFHAVAKFFGGPEVDPNNLASGPIMRGLPNNLASGFIIRGLPRFGSHVFLRSAASKHIFEAEALHLLNHLKTTPPANKILYHPFFWTSGKRLQFLVDTWEFVKYLETSENQTNIKCPTKANIVTKIAAITTGSNLTDALPLEFAEDLKHSTSTNFPPYSLLRAIRNCRVHSFTDGGFKSKSDLTMLDRDPMRGFDLMISAFWPNFFIGIYDVMSSQILSPPYLPISFKKYLLKDYKMD